ncbi:hypothetical protein HDV00_011844 [Rhizophlyctis rosea]|nr:hypothetical protein HDV00_011844 [Rhizophlyctis rosea]
MSTLKTPLRELNTSENTHPDSPTSRSAPFLYQYDGSPSHHDHEDPLELESISLAMTARLREAVPEYVRLDERHMALAATESRVKHTRQRLQLTTAELRGGLNEVAYLQDRLARERQALASAILVPKNRRSEHDDLLEDLTQKLEEANQQVELLRQQERALNEEAFDTDMRALRHVRNLLESLYERVFDVEGPSGFPEEDAIKQSMTLAHNQIEKMGRKVKNVETAKQLLGRVENLLLEARSISDANAQSFRKRSKSVDANFDMHKLDSALNLYEEATRVYPSLPPADTSKSTFTTLIAPPRPTPYHECLLLLRKVQDTNPRLNRESETLRRDLRTTEHHLKELQSRLLKERVRILRAAVLSRDRDRARRDGTRYVRMSQRVLMEEQVNDVREDEDLPPPYSPPDYDVTNGSHQPASNSNISTPVAIPIPTRRGGISGTSSLSTSNINGRLSPSLASPPYERVASPTSFARSLDHSSLNRPQYSSSFYASPPATPLVGSPPSNYSTPSRLHISTRTITEEPDTTGSLETSPLDVADNRPLSLLAIGSSVSLGRPRRTGMGLNSSTTSLTLTRFATTNQANPMPSTGENDIFNPRASIDLLSDDDDLIPLRRAVSLRQPRTSIDSGARVGNGLGSGSTTNLPRTGTDLRRSLSHSSSGSVRDAMPQSRRGSAPSSELVDSVGGVRAGAGNTAGSAPIAGDEPRTHRYRTRNRDGDRDGSGRERDRERRGRQRRRHPNVPLVSLIPGGIPVPPVPPQLGQSAPSPSRVAMEEDDEQPLAALTMGRGAGGYSLRG